jgi:hypothetical protein
LEKYSRKLCEKTDQKKFLRYSFLVIMTYCFASNRG